MKKNAKRFFSCILTVCIILASVSVIAVAVETANTEYYPSIVIPGIFQSEVKLYDENGDVMLNSEGKEYSPPFFMGETMEIVEQALTKALMPLTSLLALQYDINGRCADAVAEVLGSALLSRVASDNQGKLIFNVKATEYNTNAANLSDYDLDYILDQIPLNDYVDIAGAENLYFYSYVSFGNMKEIAEGLYDLIQIAKEESGKDKVNLVPISQGGSVATALIQYYEDTEGIEFADDVNRVCYIVPAADGSSLLGEIYEYGLLDDADALYGTMFPSLLDSDQQTLAYLINIILRILPNADVNNIIDTAVDVLVEDYLEYSTALWGLIPSANYPAAAEKYLSDEEDKFIREQTDWYYNAQCNLDSYLLKYKSQGVEIFDIVDYNCSLYQICDSWDDVNADGIIQLDSTSFGATSLGVDVKLPDDYTAAGTYCTCGNPENHIDSYRIVDASTGILCERTFYFYGQNHEQTARNDVIIKLATRILTDESFENVYSDPAFPQFNNSRNSRGFISTIKQWQEYDASALSSADAAELAAALEQAQTVIDNTVVDNEEYEAAKSRLESIIYKIQNGTEKPAPQPENEWSFDAVLLKLIKFYSDLLLRFFGGKGFSDILLFR